MTLAWRRLHATAATILVTTAPAAAQTAAAADPAGAAVTQQSEPSTSTDGAAASDPAGDEIVVTGSYARSIAAATEAKRKAAYGLDSISSTDIGKFPTQNVAEALQIVPGVAITRPRGEGLYVSVRGLGPQFQNTLLNGRTVALNEFVENGGATGRQFRFEMLPAEFVSSIDVVKTPTADMNEGALGGNIDVKTFHPLDIESGTTLNARYTHTSKTGRVEPNVTLLSSYKNTDGTFGILAGAQYWGKQVRNDRLINFGWNKDKFAGTLGAGFYVPSRTRPTIETEDRKRISGIVSAQWAPTSELKTTLDVLATRLDIGYDEFGIDIYPDDPGTSLVAGSQKVVGDTVVGATINNVRFMASREYSLNRHDLLSVALRQTWDRDRWHVSATGSWSFAHSLQPGNDVGTVRSRAQFFAPFTYDGSGGYKALPSLTTTRSLVDPANYVVSTFNIAPKNSKDWDIYGRGDVSYDVGGFLTRIAAGGEYHWRKRDYRRRDYLVTAKENPLIGQRVAVLGSTANNALPFDDFFAGTAGNLPRTWLTPVTEEYYAKLFNTTLENAPLTSADRRASFLTTEKIASGYVRADYELALGSVAVTGNVGARYVHTNQVASGTLTAGSVATPVSYPRKFNNVLPSFNLKAELTSRLIARLAASRVLTRPNITDSAPRITVATDSPTASGGNPELKPFLATQFDGSLEWYFNRRGALAASVFYKKLDDYITAENRYIDVPGRGQVLLSTQVNGGKAKLYGAEASYNQVFTFLPKPLDGLGLQASYTYTAVKAAYTAGSRPIVNQLIGLSKQSANVTGFYEMGPLAARVSYVWRDKYLSGIGSNILAPTYTAAFGSLDGNISVAVTPQITFSIEAINIAKAKAYVYADKTDRFGEINDYGRTILFGARARF